MKCNTGLKWVNQLAMTTTEYLLSRHTNQDILRFIMKNFSSGIYLFKVNNGNTRTMYQIFSDLTI